MNCKCGYDLGEPEYADTWLDWEECPNCERKLCFLENDKKNIEDKQALLRVARALKGLADNPDVVMTDNKYYIGIGYKEWTEAIEALKDLPEHLLENN